MRSQTRAPEVRGWIALGIGTAIAALWAFWGILENFHEGWWTPGLGSRVLGFLAYMSPMLLCMAMLAAAILHPKVGGALYFLLGALFTGFIFKERWGNLNLTIILSWIPVTLLVVALGVLWWFSRLRRSRLVYAIAMGVPLLTAIGFGVEPAWRVSHRIDDGNRGERRINENGVDLVWAPAGPGWVRDAKHACDWPTASDLCARLTLDGAALADTAIGIWRLPTADEVVRSSARHGRNSGGEWDSLRARARYERRPDKESPLWDSNAETIYWWTATEVGDRDAYRDAYRYVYNGDVYRSPKKLRMGTLGFRAVRQPDTIEPR